MHKLLILGTMLLSGILHSSFALAQSVQTGNLEANCAEPQSQLEMNVCARLGFETADKELNEAYREVRADMRKTDQFLEKRLKGAENALLKGQRAWITYRDGACETEGFVFRGGSMEPFIISACKERLTRRRTEDLRKIIDMKK